MVIGLILSGPLPLLVVFSLPLLVSSRWIKIKNIVRIFLSASPVALAAAIACSVLPNGWFTLHIAVRAGFVLSSWDATVERAKIHSPLWLSCWLNCPDRSRSSQSHEVQNIWDVYIREVGFLPFEVFHLCDCSDVDSSWLLLSREAEASLARAYLAAGGPPFSNPGSYVGRGSPSICTMRLGGRRHDRIHHVDRADGFDVTHSDFFLNFSCTCSVLYAQFRLCMQCSYRY